MRIPIIQVLHAFRKENYELFEIKRLNMDSDNPSDIYFWFLYTANQETLERLAFISMDTNQDEETRIFKQGLLQFNKEKAVFTFNNKKSIQLKVNKACTIPSMLALSIEQYFRFINTPLSL